MKCEICGRQFVALGVHIRLKHAIDPDDYRDEFGILRITPLVDKDLSEHLSAQAKLRLTDADYKAEVQARCRENGDARKGRPGVGMSRAGKAALAKRNTENNAAYLSARASLVAHVVREKKTLLDVRRMLGTGPIAAKKIIAAEGVNYSPKLARAERDKRTAATIRAKTMTRVAKVMPYFGTTKSAAEMCRLAGINIKTYKNWLCAGLIQRHPNGRGPRASLPADTHG